MKWNKEKVINVVKELEKSLGRRPIKKDSSNLYFLSREHFGTWNNMMKEAGYIVKNKQELTIKNTNNSEFYYFLGLLITDGHVVINKNKRDNKIKIYTSYEEEKEMIMRLIFYLFNYKASIRKRLMGFEKNINYEIYISSKDLCNFLSEKIKFPIGAKSLTVRVPRLIFNINQGNIGAFVRGIIDGDGTITKIPSVKIPSGSKLFLSDIKILLEKIGIKSGKINQERDNLYTIWICGRDNLKKLREILYKSANFYYTRKKKLWEQYI